MFLILSGDKYFYRNETLLLYNIEERERSLFYRVTTHGRVTTQVIFKSKLLVTHYILFASQLAGHHYLSMISVILIYEVVQYM